VLEWINRHRDDHRRGTGLVLLRNIIPAPTGKPSRPQLSDGKPKKPE